MTNKNTLKIYAGLYVAANTEDLTGTHYKEQAERMDINITPCTIETLFRHRLVYVDRTEFFTMYIDGERIEMHRRHYRISKEGENILYNRMEVILKSDDIEYIIPCEPHTTGGKYSK